MASLLVFAGPGCEGGGCFPWAKIGPRNAEEALLMLAATLACGIVDCWKLSLCLAVSAFEISANTWKTFARFVHWLFGPGSIARMIATSSWSGFASADTQRPARPGMASRTHTHTQPGRQARRQALRPACIHLHLHLRLRLQLLHVHVTSKHPRTRRCTCTYAYSIA